MMRGHYSRFGLALSLAAALPAAVQAQGTPAAPAPAPALKVGDEAPDFTLPVSTREGQGNVPARLRDFRGQTVVLAFFPKARTGG
jgi:peroxiredoxin Q/BCP